MKKLILSNMTFSYGTQTEDFYCTLAGQSKDRVLYYDNHGKFFYNYKGKQYLTDKETINLRKFMSTI